MADDTVRADIELNLVQACLGQITEAHQAITYSYESASKLCHLSTYLSHINEDILGAVQEIADELYIRVNCFNVNVTNNIIIDHQGVLKLMPNDSMFFLRKGFGVLTVALEE